MEGGDGGKGVTLVGWGSRGFVRLDFQVAGEGIVGITGVGASGKASKPSGKASIVVVAAGA